MSNSNGRIYIDTSTTPNKGVSFADVQQTLGTSTNDLGRLCTHENINMLSRRKPTPYTGFDSGAEQAAYIDAGANYDLYAGGIFKQTTIVTDDQYPAANVGTLQFVQNLDLLSSQWTYQRPSSPAKFRLLDFNEYLHYGAISYPKTASKYPYETATDYRLTSGGYLEIASMLRFNLSDVQLYGAVAGLLGLKELLAEKDTELSNLDLRYGFILRVKTAAEGGFYRRNTPLSMLYIHNRNIVSDNTNGYQTITANTGSTSIFVDNPNQMNSTHILYNVETAYICPFIAKRYHTGSGTNNCWLLYGLGVTTPPIFPALMTAHAMSIGATAGSSIKLTLLIKEDGTYVFYIKENMDFDLWVSTSSREVFGQIPVAIGAGENCVSGKPTEIMFGTQDSSCGYWYWTSNVQVRASDIIGWSSTDAPENRAGSLIVKPMASTFTIYACINTPVWPRQKTWTVNTATAQTGDEFPWTVTNQ